MTSANLTEAAFDRNIEIGLVVRDRALAASVSSHFRQLIDGDCFIRFRWRDFLQTRLTAGVECGEESRV